MKLSINLLPPKPEVEALQAKKKAVVKISTALLLIFLVVNLVIFGFYWFLTKNTADTLAAIKREEAKITSLAPTEKLYRALSAKLSYFSSLWQKKTNPKEVVDFAQTLLVEKVTLAKISLRQDGLTTLNFIVADSDALENFLSKTMEKEKSGQIKDAKVISTNRNQEGGYDLSISFKFLGAK